MIRLVDLCKDYPTAHGRTSILRNVNLTVNRGEKVGILGRNGSGKSTMVRLLSGAERPTSGSVIRDMTVSWPLAFGGAFQSSLTGMDNLRFICRVYGVSAEDKVGFVQDFSELGPYLYEPIRIYSSGMRARLAFAISMMIEFDCFLIDEVVAVGDARFQQKSHYELFEKRADRSFIIVSHDPAYLRSVCTTLCVLSHGHLAIFHDADEAYEAYHAAIDFQ